MSWRPRRISRQLILLFSITIVWVLLWGKWSWANILTGMLLAAVIVRYLPLPAIGYKGRLNLWWLLVLTVRFLWDLTVASVQIAWHALLPKYHPVGAIVGVQLRNPGDLYLTITAEMSTLIPGSIVIEAHRLTGMVYLHVFDLELSGGEDAVRESILDLEARVLRAFASAEERKRVGVA